MTLRITRTPTPQEQEDQALALDEIVRKLATATDAEIETFIDNQVVDLVSVRRVLKVYGMILKRLIRLAVKYV